MKKNSEKKLLLEHLRKTPIVQFACERSGISRATYYRWRKESKTFAEAADAAIREGSMLISDLAEGQLISAIKDKQLSAIAFWLRAHHPIYANKLEVTGRMEHTPAKLNKEQKALVRRALRLAKLQPVDAKKKSHGSQTGK